MSVPAVWLRGLVSSIAKEIAPFREAAPLNCHYIPQDDTWEITVFMEPVEVVGGPQDGSIVQLPYGVRITPLLAMFDHVKNCSWQTARVGRDDDLGAHLAIEGIYQGHQVWLRILANAPERLRNGREMVISRILTEDPW